MSIISNYENLLEDVSDDEEKLALYINMYQECMDLIDKEVWNKETPILFEKDMCGTDSVLIVYEDKDSIKDS